MTDDTTNTPGPLGLGEPCESIFEILDAWADALAALRLSRLRLRRLARAAKSPALAATRAGPAAARARAVAKTLLGGIKGAMRTLDGAAPDAVRRLADDGR